MQLNVTQLSKKAVTAALNQKWEEAIELNKEILQRDPFNIDAKLRLGRAYIYVKDHQKARKMFKEVLCTDPINQVALKNLELLSHDKISLAKENTISTKSLIKEPGTTTEVEVEITAKGLTAESLVPSEQLGIKVKKRSLDIIRMYNKKPTELATIINPELVSKMNLLCDSEGTYKASFVKGSGKYIQILIHASSPIFKSDKQDIRPYLKKGSLDEPDNENEEIDITE